MNTFEINVLVAIQRELDKKKPDLPALDLLYGVLHPEGGDGTRLDQLLEIGGVKVERPEA
ncbi:TPA: hypothetical protein DD448_01370 [Candidatus Collierbacteria bacterium]|nr:MAG: hypothetical protein UX32_C0012G0011 [Microgenomates group bacterium GW2011_GWF1_46_12]KKU27694.1 MAG: hypothetical protein UX40_C0008G0015 [Microgenomates group bacterium GW2011_GWF2_46_18]KKU43351.1 MAG: hypothetical protein UX59_C0021G0009 [Microgenomates group bacterium GW2011_GWA1_46_7]KKU44839.1 MAG: hypothetical protein UX63_C0020G0011 [Microgenomates group bacterium GW2011_GWB1_46_7]KKU60607.1 MAG: hypothetical protein UX82_C0009G0010 [Microgenomates group bacterium GW2011_GWE1_